MKILLIRKYKKEAYTIGDLMVNGNFFCNTIEDKVRSLKATCPNTPKFKACQCSEKVYAETAIPEGIYKITMEQSPRFKKILPYLHDVPHFLGILIHSGNTAEHSAGCIIVGYNSQPGKVLKSMIILASLIILIEQAIANKEEISIEIR